MVKIHGNSKTSIAEANGIPVTTFRRYIGKIDKANVDVSKETDDVLKDILNNLSQIGPKPILNNEQEEELEKYLLRASSLYYGLSIEELRVMAYEYAKKINVKYPSSWDKNGQASREYYYSFMNRHRNLTLPTPEQVSEHRAKSFNKENVASFFRNLEVVLETPYSPSRIWNMDETGIPTVPTRVIKVISEKGARNVGQKTSQERGTTVSFAVAVSASGVCIPPMYLFPRKNMKQIYMAHGAPEAVGYANGGGWMTAEEFLKFLQHFIEHSGARKGSPTLLLVDNHASHLSIAALDLAVEYDITMLSFPPHCTHKMQPLDVSVFSSFKSVISQQHNLWQKNNVGVKYDLHHVPLIAEQALDIAATPKSIKSGFKTTGIFPFNPNVFSESDYVAAESSGENLIGVEDDNAEEQRRIVVLTDRDMPSTSGLASASTLVSMSSVDTSTSSLRDVLKSVGPLKLGTPAKKSNRGRKPMKSTILTSLENVSTTRAKHDAKLKKLDNQKKKVDSIKKMSAGKKKTTAGKKKTASKRKTPSAQSTGKRMKQKKMSIEIFVFCAWN
ncbi:uncharacterized protein LOC122501547 [Leptopilina heterotoma]|uniref:uncharacterized protein LOC122501547 n=1 Tax=Leptopilina heterotoma TaxID=63436 RepID=UPI001CA85D79|nr:uncharacterized protein LOC122501547 [Leptopilina heterotoma]